MTNDQAAALQAKWKKQVDPLPCEHITLELENTATGYLTGIYHCVTCGESITRPLVPFKTDPAARFNFLSPVSTASGDYLPHTTPPPERVASNEE